MAAPMLRRRLGTLEDDETGLVRPLVFIVSLAAAASGRRNLWEERRERRSAENLEHMGLMGLLKRGEIFFTSWCGGRWACKTAEVVWAGANS